ncbi:hypothetical protein ACIHEJ_01585 [Streptomyces sp. NPDC052301]|uniref:hypothetical protein n=1 Tax=Streptomyces sp. NPDC052301 TaxID=3365687 RepID=UPI0037D320F6
MSPRTVPAVGTPDGGGARGSAGHGTQVVRLPAHPEPGVLTFTHQVPRHRLLDAPAGRLRSLGRLGCADGPFTGRFLVSTPDARVHALRVQADGPWTAGTSPLAAAPPVTAEEHRPASDVLHPARTLCDPRPRGRTLVHQRAAAWGHIGAAAPSTYRLRPGTVLPAP